MSGAGPTPWGTFTAFDISAATVVKNGRGVLVRVQVLVAGTTAGTANDTNAIGSAALANQIAAIPAAVGTYDIGMPCNTGILIVPGTSQVIAASYA
jgi:hypothetical protein